MNKRDYFTLSRDSLMTLSFCSPSDIFGISHFTHALSIQSLDQKNLFSNLYL